MLRYGDDEEEVLENEGEEVAGVNASEIAEIELDDDDDDEEEFEEDSEEDDDDLSEFLEE